MKIIFLKIFTAHLEEQLHFYEQVLQLDVPNKGKDFFEVKIGYSRLRFEKALNAKPYHVAFHIPARQEEQALEWLEKRVEILKNGSDKVVDFPAWKAKSVYFYDADKNILEFISRKDLFQQMDQDFSSNSLLGLSEIGLATKDVEEKYKVLNELSGMEIYTGDTNIFCATGDKEGLFIIVNKHQKKWFPSGDKAYSSAFEIKFVVNNITYSAAYENESLRIL